MQEKNGIHIRIQQEKSYQNYEFFFLGFEKVSKKQASVISVEEKMRFRVDRKVSKWFGRVERMSDDWLINKLYESSVEDRRHRGKPC